MYWAAAQLKPQQERLALHCLALAGFEAYLPRLRERGVRRGHRIEAISPLFPEGGDGRVRQGGGKNRAQNFPSNV